ncbi:MAG: mechanosensitive ion channel [Desulfovibrio sp.]|jgi:small-conductance mechanosensitive channel|nr:mechanosensitive ion channel [Desulfovibrio sp.]
MFRHCATLIFLLTMLLIAMSAFFPIARAAASDAQAPVQSEQNGKPDSRQPPQTESDPWENVWAGQRDMLNDINTTAATLRKKATDDTAGLNEKARPYEEEFRRLLVLANTFKDWPNPLEAVSRRITATSYQVRAMLDPVIQARTETQGLLDRVSQIADNLPEEVRKGSVSAEMQAYVKDVGQARSRLAAVLNQYDAALAPFQTMLKRLQETRDDIAARLPLLWTNYYLQEPVSWLNLDLWKESVGRMSYFLPGLRLRLPVELPAAVDQWSTAALRFLVCLFFGGLLTVLLSRRWLNAQSPPASHHVFKVSLPCLCVGIALIGSSVSATGEFFRLLLAIGNLVIIVGQIFLAWDLRLLQHPQDSPAGAPFWRLFPLTFCAYALLYLPLGVPFTHLVWTVLAIVTLTLARRRVLTSFKSLHLENGVLETEPAVLWVCLALSLAGLHIYSMTLYLLFASCSLGFEICLGGMSLIGRISESLPKEGVRSALTHLVIALAAPFVLTAAVASAMLWVGTLPGGLDMLRHYGFQGMNVGGTQFNIIQLLLVVSAFYLTRAAVDMGSRFLYQLPSQQGLQIDATLIPSLQTTFTYAMWCVFALFTLRSLGMELSSLAMVAGGLSVGIGFGMQTIVNNFVSGLILIFSRTLQAGDVVEVGGTTGKVRKISVRATMVETFDNALIYVPNSEFVSSRLINWTRNSRSVRREIKVGVAYGANVEQVTHLLLAVANKHANVLKYPVPTVVFSDFGASTLDFALRVWVRDYDVGSSTSSDIRLAIEEQFRKNHIEIAFPQLDVHIRDMPPRIANRRHPGNSLKTREKCWLQKKRKTTIKPKETA